MHQFLIFIFRIELYITSIIAARIMESIYFSLTNKYIFLLNLEKFKFTWKYTNYVHFRVNLNFSKFNKKCIFWWVKNV